MFFEFVLGVAFYGFLASTACTAINNAATDSRLRRKGIVIDKSRSSFIEKLTYFIQDYAFLLVPFYNIKKGIFDNFFKKSALKYEEERLLKHSQRGLIVDKKEVAEKKKETKKANTQTNTESNTQTKEQTQTQVQTQTVQTQNVQTQDNTQPTVALPQKDLTDEQKLQMIRTRLKQRIAEYQQAEEDMTLPYTNRKLMYDCIINDQKTVQYLEARIARQAQLDALKTAKNNAQNVQTQAAGNVPTRLTL